MRNYETLRFEPSSGLNIITGGNAQGKTNLLEGIALLGMGRSFRTAHDRDIVREGTLRAVATGSARLHSGEIRLACTIDASTTATRKRYAVNGQPVRYAAYLGTVRVVAFAPPDVGLTSGPPSARRSFLNAALAQESAIYHEALLAYTRALEQKQALLRGLVPWDDGLLDVYDERLAREGETIVAHRAAFAAELAPAAARAYANVAPRDGELGVRYRPDIEAGSFEAALRAARPIERARRRALRGPHRDDVEIRIADRPVAVFGSQAQRRSGALALKLAELDIARSRSGESPLGLFDDVLSELDPERGDALIALLRTYEQVFVTTAASAPAGPQAVFEIAAATLRRVA